MPLATSEEKHPLYYRPQKRPWQCQEDQVYTGCFLFSARGREEGNKPNQLYSRLFGARKHAAVQQREAVGERGTGRDEGGHLCHPPLPPRDACKEFATHLETHKRQMHFAAPPRLHPPCAAERCRRPPHLPASPKWSNTLSAEGEQVPGGISDRNLLAEEEGGGEGGWFPVTQTLAGGEADRSPLHSSPLSAAMGSLVHLSVTSWLPV